jgi:hypothetical protein
MWQEALVIGTDRLMFLRRYQAISLLTMVCLFYLLCVFTSPLNSFVLANGMYILTLRFLISINLRKSGIISEVKVKKFIDYRIFFNDLRYVLPVSLVALITGRLIYFLGLTGLEDHASALFVTLYSLLSITSFMSSIYKESKAFELTKEVSFAIKFIRHSFLWQLGVFIVSFIILFCLKDLIVDYRPEFEDLGYSRAALFYIVGFLESIMALFAVVLLNNQDYSYVKWYCLIMLGLNAILTLLYFYGGLTVNVLMSLVAVGYLVYCFALLMLLLARR